MENLKELLGEELYNQVVERLGEGDFFFAKGKDFIPKSRMDEINEQNKELKEQLTERDNQLNELSKLTTNNEELQKQIDELTEANTKTIADYEDRIIAREKDYQIKNALKESGARNTKAILGLLDQEQIIFDTETQTVKGVSEQLDEIRGTDPYLFAEPKVKAGTEPTQTGTTPVEEWVEAFSGKEEEDSIF